MGRWPRQGTRVKSDRVYLRRDNERLCWDLVELRCEGEDRVLATFYTGSQNQAGNLALWALEQVRLTEKV